MKLSEFRDVVFLLPLFFFALSIAPNYTRSSISIGIISIGFIYVVSIVMGYKAMISEKKVFYGSLTVLFVFVYIIINLSSVFLILFGVVSLLSIIFISTKIRIVANAILGICVFILSYITITGFGVNQLFQQKIALALIPAMLLLTCYKAKTKNRWIFILFLLAFAINNYIRIENLSYAGVLILLFIPRIIEEIRNGKSKLIDGFTAFSLNLFFIYYVLFSTHLIQALQGGY